MDLPDRQRALDELEPTLGTPYMLSPGRLRVDPDFTPLRIEPRFQRLIGGGQ
jgi:hypothetical protein